jgi:hypothetical protein
VAFENIESIDKSKLEEILALPEKGYTYELTKTDLTWGAQII